MSNKSKLVEIDHVTDTNVVKLIEVLKQAPFEGKVLDEWWWEDKIAKIADHLIANGVTVQEWISVKDRLPEENKRVLGTKMGADKIYVFLGKYHNKQWIDLDWNCYRYGVTHWMPLPEPPKGE